MESGKRWREDDGAAVSKKRDSYSHQGKQEKGEEITERNLEFNLFRTSDMTWYAKMYFRE